MDLFILPKETLQEEIAEINKIQSYKRSRYGERRKILIGYQYITKNGHTFSLEKKRIREQNVVLTRTVILKDISTVKTKNENYSIHLLSGFNGLKTYFYGILGLSAIISLILLKYDMNMTKVRFENVIMFNGIMIFFIAVLHFYY